MPRAQAIAKISRGLGRKRTASTKPKLKFIANTWVSNTLEAPLRRQVLVGAPEPKESGWSVGIHADVPGRPRIGSITIGRDYAVKRCTSGAQMKRRLAAKGGAGRGAEGSPGRLITPRCRFYCADSVRGCARMKGMSVDLLLTDPPYNISSPYAAERQIPRRIRKTGADFIMPRGEFGEWDHGFSTEWTGTILPKVGGWAVIFCAHAQIKEYADHLAKHGFVAVGALAWHKTNPVPFNHRFKLLSAFETAVVGKRPSAKFNGKSVHNVFTYKSPSPSERLHPTQKPVKLMEELVGLFTDGGDTVLDPFAGSATALEAAVSLGRRCIGYENDPRYYGTARDKLAGILAGRR